MLVGFFDDADEALVARGAGAIDAGVDVGDVVADGAEAQAGLELADGVGECFGVLIAGAQEMEGESLRALCSDAGQFFKLFDEAGHGLCKARHGSRV